jgi:nucleotide-binding universal stress UspA family protein
MTSPAPSATREVTEVRPPGGVVVGDDGSLCAASAIKEAAEDAVRRGCVLHVVRAWSITSAVRPPDLPRGVVASLVEYEAATLDFERARVAELLPDASPDVEVHVAHGPASKILLIASETADLLVVGTRGKGGFKHLLLGSTAEQCIRYAGCSVLVVRDGR